MHEGDSPSHDNSLRKGTSLQNGKFTIVRNLGQGGFGITYEAINTKLDKSVVIKEFFMADICNRSNDGATVIVPLKSKRELFLHQKIRFCDEAKRLALLDTPHIVAVHDLFEENDTAYYVMDYLNGENLDARLKRTGKPLEESEVLVVLGQMLSALKYIHGLSPSLFHLDIKPSNIMVDEKGNFVLIDFGASKNASKTKEGVSLTTNLAYTEGFAPREQMSQDFDKIGPWTDLYSLGATLYNLLTNKMPARPLDIDDDHSADKHIALPFPDNVSDRTRQLVLALMSTDRFSRPQSVDDVWKMLGVDKDVSEDDENENSDAGSQGEISGEVSEETIVSTDETNGGPNEDNGTAVRPGKKLRSMLWRIGIAIVSAALVAAVTFVVMNQRKGDVIIAGCPDGNHPHTINLGLPSGVKWSCCNVGASNPSDFGNYYAWGETETKSDYSKSTSNYYEDFMVDICGSSKDVARVELGGSWQLPSSADIDELFENCDTTVTSVNGVKGMLFTGKYGKSIFLPFAGNSYGSSSTSQGTYGYYWSGTPSAGIGNYAYCLYVCDNGDANRYSCFRNEVGSVRPVIK